MQRIADMDAYQQSAELLKAMAHPERLRLLAALRDGAQCVCHLTGLLGQRQPYVSQQLAYLRDAGLVADFKEGLNVHYRVSDPRIFALIDLVGDMIGEREGLRAIPGQVRALAGCPCPRCATGERTATSRSFGTDQVGRSVNERSAP
jgi:ArsR family transcriptional regulator